MAIPAIQLNDGETIPQLGLGVWQARDGSEVKQAVLSALQAGYRLIDTAAMYGNEQGVGEAIRESGIPREEIKVTTKLWNSSHGRKSAIKAFDASLSALGLDYIDLYLIHWPVPKQNMFVETWQALEELKQSGRATSIGVCNFAIEHLERLQAESSTVPSINQIELHPRLQQQELRHYCREHLIQVESWSPIGGNGGDLLSDPLLVEIASAYQKTPAQIVIRWHIQLELIVIPKSVHENRIIQNADVFDFELSAQDMERIGTLNTDTRRGPDPMTFNNQMKTPVVRFFDSIGFTKFRK